MALELKSREWLKEKVIWSSERSAGNDTFYLAGVSLYAITGYKGKVSIFTAQNRKGSNPGDCLATGRLPDVIDFLEGFQL